MFGLPGMDMFGGGGGSGGNFDGGGVGNSASTTTTTTDGGDWGADTGGGSATFTRDQRTYRTDITGSNNTTTDYGAVSDSLALALRGVELANTNVQQTNTSTAGILSGALSMVGKQQTEFTSAVEKIKLGNSDSMLIVVGLAVLAVGAVAIFRKG